MDYLLQEGTGSRTGYGTGTYGTGLYGEPSVEAIWLLGVTTDGLLTTTLTSGTPTTLFINTGLQSWQVGVASGGLLTTTAVAYSAARPSFIVLTDSLGQTWLMLVLANGLLETIRGSVLHPIWVPNGFGAQTDNAIVGGGGGYMAYPQPLASGTVSVDPEQNGQCAPLTFEFDSNDVLFEIVNPGRNG